MNRISEISPETLVVNSLRFECNSVMQGVIVATLFKGETLSFESLIPTPLSVYQEHLSEEDIEDFGDRTWPVWRKKNWGVERDVFHTKTHYVKEDAVRLEFCTIGGVPFPFIIAISNSFPSVSFIHDFCTEDESVFGSDRWYNGTRIIRDRKPELIHALRTILPLGQLGDKNENY